MEFVKINLFEIIKNFFKNKFSSSTCYTKINFRLKIGKICEVIGEKMVFPLAPLIVYICDLYRANDGMSMIHFYHFLLFLQKHVIRQLLNLFHCPESSEITAYNYFESIPFRTSRSFHISAQKS